MKIDDTMIGLLKDFETAVIDHWHTNRDLSDHAVTRVYEAAAQVYDAELRGRRPRPHGLTGSELDLFENVRSVAEYRLGRGPRTGRATADVVPQPLEGVHRAFRELVKSVGARTERGGRQGYLTYVEPFIPKE
jgi:hypothetical protein